jgi:hypothetical protein
MDTTNILLNMHGTIDIRDRKILARKKICILVQETKILQMQVQRDHTNAIYNLSSCLHTLLSITKDTVISH